ncbi:MAG: IPT/TIG domain-containing protein [Terracidiphilus sp.]
MLTPISASPRAAAVPFFKAHLHILAFVFLAPAVALAGGPKYVAGVSFFNPAALGQPLHWAGGQVSYYVDQGPLNASVSNQQATAMVDAAAALWSAIPTAGVTLTDMGQLNEDVNGSNIVVGGTNFTVTNEQLSQLGQIAAPSDVAPSATGYPLGVIYDADGSVTDALFGPGSSDPTSCQNNGVWVWLDNVNPDATIAHGIILLNGLCATNSNLLEMMSYELERAFGRILGLDYAQANLTALTDQLPGGAQGWPVMQPLSGVCSQTGGICIPDPSLLRYDDIAALNRIYPITAQNLASFPGKQLTAANTVSIQGAVAFSTGVGMQGVNVVARPLDSNGNPIYQYTVTFVSGGYFSGNHGNPITGFADSNGNLLTMWGSNDPALQGYFDLSGIPLPPGVTTANYQVTFEAINPLYILTDSVGPYLDGQVTPSGALPSISVPALSAGSSQTLTVNVAGSVAGGFQDAIGTQAAPRILPPSGLWCGRLSQVGQSDWFTFPVRGNRTFTIVTQALDETGAPTDAKAMPALGVWDAFDPLGAPAVGVGPGMNGLATGESWLRVSSVAADVVRIGIADQRGDGRPDYTYNGWVLYADTVQPQRLPASGGPIVIHGMGFRLADTVLVGGQPAVVTSISPNEITAIAPPAASGVTGSVDVEVDDLPIFYAAAILSGGASYDSGTGDALTLFTAPANTVPIGVPIPFSVTALGPALTPASGVTVTYAVTSGTATLSCGQPACSATATGDGRASMDVTAVNGTWSIVTASLTNGSSLQAQFAGGTPPVLASLTPQLSLAAGATFTWTVQALVLANGLPIGGQSVAWQMPSSGIAAQGSAAAITNSSGIAVNQLTVGPLTEGQQISANACLNGTRQCVAFTAYGARPEYALLEAVSGTTQSLSVQSTPSQITLRLLDMDCNPMAGGSVALYQALYAWAPPCAPHGPCIQGALLATQAATAVSAIDGTVAFTPASLPAVATNLLALAASGNTSTVSIAIQQHP